MTKPSTQALYDQHATDWVRMEPILLSDYTARPAVLASVGDAINRSVVDIGCGEGYMSRQLASRGTESILAIDQSEEMIERAIAQNTIDGFNIDYRADSATEWNPPEQTFDIALVVFLLNYLTIDQSIESLHKARRALKPGGRLILTVPHPALPWLRAEKPPFYFCRPARNYTECSDMQLEGKIWRRDGTAVPVRCRHKTFDDLFRILRHAGFDQSIDVTELAVTDEHLQLDPAFFGPLRGIPLHLLIQTMR